MNKLLFLFFLLSYINPHLINYGYYQGTLPSYIHRVYVTPSSSLYLNLSWPGGENFDLYLYSSGMDVLSGNNNLAKRTTNNKPEILSYTTSSNFTGAYYVRVDTN